MYKILIVEDENLISLMIEQTLKENGFEVVDVLIHGQDVIDYDMSDVDLITMDIQLNNDINGVEAAIEVRKKFDNVSVLFCTANQNTYLNIFKKLKYFDAITKPFNGKDILEKIKQMLKDKE